MKNNWRYQNVILREIPSNSSSIQVKNSLIQSTSLQIDKRKKWVFVSVFYKFRLIRYNKNIKGFFDKNDT